MLSLASPRLPLLLQPATRLRVGYHIPRLAHISDSTPTIIREMPRCLRWGALSRSRAIGSTSRPAVRPFLGRENARFCAATVLDFCCSLTVDWNVICETRHEQHNSPRQIPYPPRTQHFAKVFTRARLFFWIRKKAAKWNPIRLPICSHGSTASTLRISALESTAREFPRAQEKMAW